MAAEWSSNLLVIRENPGLFASDDEVLVNYRVQEDKYIVDDVFQEAVLIAGVGKIKPEYPFQKSILQLYPKGTSYEARQSYDLCMDIDINNRLQLITLWQFYPRFKTHKIVIK